MFIHDSNTSHFFLDGGITSLSEADSPTTPTTMATASDVPAAADPAGGITGDTDVTGSSPAHMLASYMLASSIPADHQQQQEPPPPLAHRQLAEKPAATAEGSHPTVLPPRTSSMSASATPGPFSPPSPPATLPSSSRHTSMQPLQTPQTLQSSDNERPLPSVPLSPASVLSSPKTGTPTQNHYHQHPRRHASTASTSSASHHHHRRQVSRNYRPDGLGLHPLRLLPRDVPSLHQQEMARLRQTQLAARDVRRQQWEVAQARLPKEERDAIVEAQDNAVGIFEVQRCFLARLATAENELLDSPRQRMGISPAHDRAREDVEIKRKETQEALQPLLAYGTVGTVPKKKAKPAPAGRSSTATGRPITAASKALPATPSVLPPTPPQSPRRVHRKDDSHEALHHHMHPLHVDSEGVVVEHSLTATTAVNKDEKRASTTIKRASLVFGWAMPGGAR